MCYLGSTGRFTASRLTATDGDFGHVLILKPLRAEQWSHIGWARGLGVAFHCPATHAFVCLMAARMSPWNQRRAPKTRDVAHAKELIYGGSS